MPIFFDENQLTEAQRARYRWAVEEYARIQAANQAERQQAGKPATEHHISPKSALFARLLDGKPGLPHPPPTSYSYPWYDIIEKPGQYHVTIGTPWSALSSVNYDGIPAGAPHIVLNQCAWALVRGNEAGTAFLRFLAEVRDPRAVPQEAMQQLQSALAAQPELVLCYGAWGEFRLTMGRIIRRGRREAALNCRFDIHTLDGGNAVIVKVLRDGAELRAKSEAAMAEMRAKLETRQDGSGELDRILLASESAVRHAAAPDGDDLVEYDCDGWVLEKL